jgi:L-cysteate sulfo-lyase
MSLPVLTPAELRARVDRVPRVRLAHLPTPLDDAPHFSREIGGGVRVLIKRDDCTGLLMGGNKARHNEFLLGDAVDQGCDLFVWGAGVQSNNCRQTAAACAKLGLECRLYLCRGQEREPEVTGNLLLNYLVGAHVEFVDATIGPELDAILKAKADEFRAKGRKPYVWDRNRVVPRAALGYVLCAAEIVEQCRDLKIEPAAVYVSSGGSTGAGLALGAKVLGLTCPVRSVGYIQWPWDTAAEMAKHANAVAELLGLPHRLRPEDVLYTNDYLGEFYGQMTAEGRAALRLLARTEAVLLDPVYTSKALACLIDDVRTGRLPAGSSVVFLHTGGAPAVFAYGKEVLAGERGA